MRIAKTHLIIGGAIIATVAVAGFIARPEPIVVDTARVAEQALEATIDADGRTRVRQRYLVVTPVAGRLERIHVTEGDEFRAGEVVARITPAPLDSQALLQAHARIDAAAALALQAAGQVRVATALRDQRRRELSRATRLADVGGVAARVVEECELGAAEAEENARGAAERARAADADLAQAKAVLAGRNGSNAVTLVRAPASGRILRVVERSERIVPAGAPILEMGDPSSLEIVIDVLSSEAARIQIGDKVRVRDWRTANGEEMPELGGRVREIEPSGFTKVSALGVEEQRVNAIIDVDSLPTGVADGFRAEVSIVIWSTPKAVAVPRSALLQAEGVRESSVFVVANGRATTRLVKVGHLAGASAEVLSGLAVGDEVVLFPPERLLAGARVKRRE